MRRFVLKNIIIPFLITASCSVSFSQSVDKTSYLKNMDQLLAKQSYKDFETSLIISPLSVQERINYLEGKSQSGHAIVYWLLSSYFAKQVVEQKFLVTDKKLIEYVKKNLYIAIVLTQQDSNSCMDHYARNATSLYLKQYGQLVDFERRYPIDNIAVFDEALSAINSFKNRPFYSWPCTMFVDKDSDAFGKYYPPADVLNIRKNIITSFRETLK